MSKIAEQLQLDGLMETRRAIEAGPDTERRKQKKLDRVETTHNLLSALPEPEDLGFLHSGLCQTFLPHSRPPPDTQYWRRQSGKFTLIIRPGIIDTSAPTSRQPTPEEQAASNVGIPYGARARLILIHLQTEGLKSQTVSLGSNLSNFLRTLGLPISGGPRGSIQAIREQITRVATCSFQMSWADKDADGSSKLIYHEPTQIVKGMELLTGAKGNRDDWSATVQLSDAFHAHLKEHAVPLDKRALHGLAGNSFGLDLYALFVYRLCRLRAPVHIRWTGLQTQLGSDFKDVHMMARRIRETLPVVLDHYPQAKVELLSTGLTLHPSLPAIPKTMVNGFRLIDGSKDLPTL